MKIVAHAPEDGQRLRERVSSAYAQAVADHLRKLDTQTRNEIISYLRARHR